MSYIGFKGTTEYICTWCGQRIKRSGLAGRPAPGYCPRRPRGRDGKMSPHVWRVNRRFE